MHTTEKRVLAEHILEVSCDCLLLFWTGSCELIFSECSSDGQGTLLNLNLLSSRMVSSDRRSRNWLSDQSARKLMAPLNHFLFLKFSNVLTARSNRRWWCMQTGYLMKRLRDTFNGCWELRLDVPRYKLKFLSNCNGKNAYTFDLTNDQGTLSLLSKPSKSVGNWRLIQLTISTHAKFCLSLQRNNLRW